MSKSITITLPNDVADTLERRMGEITKNAIPGTQSSKSAYVSAAVKVQLIKEGCVIREDEDAKPSKRKRKTAADVAAQPPVSNVADYILDGAPQDENGRETQTPPS